MNKPECPSCQHYGTTLEQATTSNMWYCPNCKAQFREQDGKLFKLYSTEETYARAVGEVEQVEQMGYHCDKCGSTYTKLADMYRNNKRELLCPACWEYHNIGAVGEVEPEEISIYPDGLQEVMTPPPSSLTQSSLVSPLLKATPLFQTSGAPLSKTEALFRLHADMCAGALTMMRSKNHDYCAGNPDADPYANFRVSEVLSGVPATSGILIRMVDKFQRLKAFVAHGTLQVKEESVSDALVDIINYCVLLKGMLEDEISPMPR